MQEDQAIAIRMNLGFMFFVASAGALIGIIIVKSIVTLKICCKQRVIDEEEDGEDPPKYESLEFSG